MVEGDEGDGEVKEFDGSPVAGFGRRLGRE